MDPKSTDDGRPYGPVRFEQIVRERYLISKHMNTSYNDVGEITPLERSYLIEYIERELRAQKEMIDKVKSNRGN